MKVISILSAALVCTGLVFAQTSTAPAAPAKAEKSVKTAEASKMIMGSVVSVDAIGNSVVIKTAKAEDTLAVEATTKIKIDGKEAKLADLTSGMKVHAVYKVQGGKNIALKISKKAEVAPTPKAAK